MFPYFNVIQSYSRSPHIHNLLFNNINTSKSYRLLGLALVCGILLTVHPLANESEKNVIKYFNNAHMRIKFRWASRLLIIKYSICSAQFKLSMQRIRSISLTQRWPWSWHNFLAKCVNAFDIIALASGNCCSWRTPKTNSNWILNAFRRLSLMSEFL